jgi:hypothetical protein
VTVGRVRSRFEQVMYAGVPGSLELAFSGGERTWPTVAAGSFSPPRPASAGEARSPRRFGWIVVASHLSCTNVAIR